MNLSAYFQELFKKKIDPFQKIIGHQALKDQIKTALITGRHMILVGPPGVGKTTLAKSIAELLPTLTVNDCGFNCLPDHPECPLCTGKGKENKKKTNTIQQKQLTGTERFIRIQGSADLTVEDLIGYIDPVKALEFGPFSLEAFTPGKIFRANHGVLFFDEINRAPEKVQNSLLQVLEEHEVTLGAYKLTLPARFILIATMNPEDSSTERLSDVFLDRFDMIYMDYPETAEDEKKILLRKQKEEKDQLPLAFPEQLLNFIVALVRSLRQSKELEKKPSVRATIGLYQRAKAHAYIQGKKAVSIKDIEAVYISVLAHRIRLMPSVKYSKEPQEILKKHFQQLVDSMDFPEEEGDVP